MPSRTLTTCGLLALLLTGGVPPSGLAADTYEAAVKQWRAERETRLKRADGYLAVAGLFFLEPGANSFGAAPGNAIVLPEGTAPARVGTFTLDGERVLLQVEHAGAVLVEGKAVERLEMKGQRLQVGRLTLGVHLSGARAAIRVWDPESRFRREFAGCRWFDVDPAWKVTADYHPYNEPRDVTIVNILGDADTMKVPGTVSFTWRGQRIELQPIGEDDGSLWFIFSDATSGKTTYKAARFLYAEAPKDGKVVLDFNKAYNPPCAFNPFTTCPLPPKSNRLGIAVDAGERDYAHEGGARRP